MPDSLSDKSPQNPIAPVEQGNDRVAVNALSGWALFRQSSKYKIGVYVLTSVILLSLSLVVWQNWKYIMHLINPPSSPAQTYPVPSFSPTPTPNQRAIQEISNQLSQELSASPSADIHQATQTLTDALKSKSVDDLKIQLSQELNTLKQYGFSQEAINTILQHVDQVETDQPDQLHHVLIQSITSVKIAQMNYSYQQQTYSN